MRRREKFNWRHIPELPLYWKPFSMFITSKFVPKALFRGRRGRIIVQLGSSGQQEEEGRMLGIPIHVIFTYFSDDHSNVSFPIKSPFF